MATASLLLPSGIPDQKRNLDNAIVKGRAQGTVFFSFFLFFIINVFLATILLCVDVFLFCFFYVELLVFCYF